MILKIVDIKHPALRKKSKEVVKIDKKIKSLVSDMKETLLSQKDPEGVGLAAPQVGKNLKIFIMHYPEAGITTKEVINPKVISISKKRIKPKNKKNENILEGCLSIPHFYGPIERASKIAIEYQNIKGKRIKEQFSGFPAQIVQHEMDHLIGVMFVDHILKNKSPLYHIKGDEWEEVELT